jgi:hypothetical protein
LKTKLTHIKPILVSLIFFATLTIHGQDIHPNFLIQSDIKVGPWKVGSDHSQFEIQLPQTWNFKADSMDNCEGCFEYYTVYSVHFGNEYLLTIEPDWDKNGKLYRFWINSNKFRLDNGFKIGMTVEELKNYYEIEEVVTGGDIGIAILVKGFSGSFKVTPNQFNGEWWNLTKDNLPNNLTISEIIIVSKN